MIGLSDVLTHSPDMRYRVLSDEAVVISQRHGTVFVLNPVGARTLELINGTSPLEHLIEIMAEEYEVDRPRLTRDVLSFATELAEAEIVHGDLPAVTSEP